MLAKNLTRAAFVAATLLAAPYVVAQPAPPHGGQGAMGGPGGPGGPSGPGQPSPSQDRYQHGGQPPHQMGMPSRPPAPPPGPGPQRWNKGDRLPNEYRDRQFVIDRWKDYDLPPPRRGYHWIGIGRDYYMVGPNGVIFQVGG